MKATRSGVHFLEDYDVVPHPPSHSGVSPLAKVAVQGFQPSNHYTAFQDFLEGSYVRQRQPAQPFHPTSAFGSDVEFGSSIFKEDFASRKLFPEACLEQEHNRQNTLHSMESTLSAIEFPGTPSKLYTEPTRIQEANHFGVAGLNFIGDQGNDYPPLERSIRLKVATAPATMIYPSSAAYQCMPSFDVRGDHTTSAAQLSSGGPICDRSSTCEASAPLPGTHGQYSFIASEAVDTQIAVSEAQRGNSLPNDIRGSLPLCPTTSSTSSIQPTQEDWNGSDASKGSDKIGINPRKTEQNRRAQARFRQRKKDMFFDQKRQIQHLTAKLEQAMREKKTYEDKSSQLQQLVDEKAKSIEAMKPYKKDNQNVEEMSRACWEFVLELKRGRRTLAHTPETIADMVNAMITWDSPALGFIRKEMVEQLVECLKIHGDRADLASDVWMNDIINAYERMLQRCGECHPQALRMFLGLQLPEQAGQTADGALWRRVLEAGCLKPDQLAQLASVRHSLNSKMQQLVTRRTDLARLVQAGGQDTAQNQQPLLGNMVQSQHVLDLHMQILKEERSAVFNFLSIVRLVLEPVQQARLMVAAYPFALDLLAICSIIADSGHSLGMLNGSLALLSQLPQDSPFQALTPNQVPPRS